jgi:hypothetical protein
MNMGMAIWGAMSGAETGMWWTAPTIPTPITPLCGRPASTTACVSLPSPCRGLDSRHVTLRHSWRAASWAS